MAYQWRNSNGDSVCERRKSMKKAIMIMAAKSVSMVKIANGSNNGEIICVI